MIEKLIFKNTSEMKPICKFGKIKKTKNNLFVKGIVPINEEGDRLINLCLKNGLLKLHQSGTIKRYENGKIIEFNVYEITIGINENKMT